MPFTVSHAIVAIPMRRTSLPVAAVATGAMVPDVALLARGVVGYEHTHSWAGVLGVDLALGLVATVLWWAVVRPVVQDLAPARVRAVLERTPPAGPPTSLRALAELMAGVLVGATSHVLWDSFTHLHGASVERWPVLLEAVGPLPAFKWLQYGSGVCGLAVLAVWGARQLRSEGAADTRPRLLGPSAGRVLTALPLVGLAVGSVGALVGVMGTVDGTVEQALFAAFRAGTLAGAAGVLVTVLVWHASARD